MNKKDISPNPQQPIDRLPSGQLPSALAELNEEALAQGGVQAHAGLGWCGCSCCSCSYDGDDE
ncbi:MAG: microcyclamide/patellamide family RiPP [Oscillatoria sp. SIO1A7]|nr:microcyclamide/patellamide family RiPP [Oscillatoria sp. SIO1A7]